MNESAFVAFFLSLDQQTRIKIIYCYFIMIEQSTGHVQVNMAFKMYGSNYAYGG